MYNYALYLDTTQPRTNDAELKPRMSWSIVLVYTCNKYTNHRFVCWIICVYTMGFRQWYAFYVNIRGLQTFYLL